MNNEQVNPLRAPLTSHATGDAYTSPWSLATRLRIALWNLIWTLFCSWTPKPCNRWRVWITRCFGARLHGMPFIHSRARIYIPWRLTMHHRACLGDGANAYSLDQITIGEGATIAQEAYLCTGTHDFARSDLPLLTAAITVEANAFIGARAFIHPGIMIGKGAVVGACAVVIRNVAEGEVVAGNPAIVLRKKNEL